MRRKHMTDENIYRDDKNKNSAYINIDPPSPFFLTNFTIFARRQLIYLQKDIAVHFALQTDGQKQPRYLQV